MSRDKKELESIVVRRTSKIQEQLNELAIKEERLQAVNAQLTRFMYKASHDLRGPLKTILGLVNLALAETQEDTIKNYLRLLKSTQAKLDTLLDHLLTVVRIKNHKIKLEPIHIEQLLANCFQKTSDSFQNKKARFDYHFQGTAIH